MLFTPQKPPIVHIQTLLFLERNRDSSLDPFRDWLLVTLRVVSPATLIGSPC